MQEGGGEEGVTEGFHMVHLASISGGNVGAEVINIRRELWLQGCIAGAAHLGQTGTLMKRQDFIFEAEMIFIKMYMEAFEQRIPEEDKYL